jgi:hypothetical protein
LAGGENAITAEKISVAVPEMKNASSSRYLQCLLALVGWAVMVTNAFSQTEPESWNSSLSITSQTDSEHVEVPVGTKLSVRYRNNPRVYRGVELKGVRDSMAILGKDTVAFKYIDRIAVRNEKRYRNAKGLLWGALAAVALSFLSDDSYNGYPPRWKLILYFTFLVYLPLLALIYLPFGLVIGVILMARAFKHYDLRKGWRLGASLKKEL